jgi:hypothetical protein
MGRPCPRCHAREPIDMHSCRAEMVLRKQRQEFLFNWDDVDGSQSPAPAKTPPQRVKPQVEMTPFLVSCGRCDLCMAGNFEYCRMLPKADA